MGQPESNGEPSDKQDELPEESDKTIIWQTVGLGWEAELIWTEVLCPDGRLLPLKIIATPTAYRALLELMAPERVEPLKGADAFCLVLDAVEIVKEDLRLLRRRIRQPQPKGLDL